MTVPQDRPRATTAEALAYLRWGAQCRRIRTRQLLVTGFALGYAVPELVRAARPATSAVSFYAAQCAILVLSGYYALRHAWLLRKRRRLFERRRFDSDVLLLSD